jgi:hypothetical protein
LTRGRRFATAAALAAIGLAGLEGASLLVISFSGRFLDEEIRTTRAIFREQSEMMRSLSANDGRRLLTLDSVLGWRYRAGYRDSVTTTNAQGLRAERVYAPKAAPGVLRLAAFGDSFVYGSEVRTQDAWPTLLEATFRDMETLNYGVGGYGVDQAYLRFLEEGQRLSPRVVLIAFSPDDMSRVVNVYRRFRSNREIPLTKPRFLPGADGELELLPNPIGSPAAYARYLERPRAIVELGAHDHWFEPAIYRDPLYDYSATVRLATSTWIKVRRRYIEADRLMREGVFNRESQAFAIQIALFEKFTEAVRAAGAVPIVVLLPDRGSVEQARAGAPTILAPIVDALRARGIDYLDATRAFQTAARPADLGDWFMRGGHYSPSGNRLVAAWIGAEVRAKLNPTALGGSHAP